MRSGPIIHGLLLAGALGVAWQTFTRDRSPATFGPTLTVWEGGGEVASIALHGKLRDVTVEKRDGYYWGKVVKTTPPPPKPAALDGGVADEVSVPGDEGTTTTTEFPLGDDGEKAVARLWPLKATRDLGASAERGEYGLGEDAEKLTVKAGGASHELLLGGRVFGGNDRYALDPAGKHVYVLGDEVVRALDAPEFALREKRLHAFAPADVAEVVLRAGGKERTVAKAAGNGWADPKTPDKPDQTLANFMERLDQLAPIDYAAPPDEKSLTPVGTIEYRAKGGKVLGSVSLAKKPAAAAGQFDYYVKSERTRVLAKVSPMAAARVDQDLAQIMK